jgi:putative multiple sugar transport system permease protein
MEKIKQLFGNNIRQYAMTIALIVIVIFFQIATGGVLLKPINITNLILQNSYIFILSIGMLLCLITGNIDLAVGSVVAFVGAVSGILSIRLGWSSIPTIVLSVLIGLVIGIWQGFWVAYVRIPAFIATLAGMLIFRGLTMVVLKGQTLAPFPPSYQLVSSGFLPDFFGIAGLHILTVLIGLILCCLYVFFEIKNRIHKKTYQFKVPNILVFISKLTAVSIVVMAFFIRIAMYKGIPNVFILIGFLIIVYSFILMKTIPGRHIYAYGGNVKAALLSGVKTQAVLFWVYANMGLLAALAGVVFTGRLNAATPKAGTGFEMDAIAACCIGGASASGGLGTVIGTIIGGLIMGVLNNGMSLLGVSVDWQQTIKGFVLLFAVAFDVYTKFKVRK